MSVISAGYLHLIPGTACDERLWTYVLPLLGDYDVSYGTYDTAATLDEMIALVAASTPAGNHLVGFSLGGYLAAEAVIRQQSQVKSLTLIATSLLGLTTEEKTLRQVNANTVVGTTYSGMSRRRLSQFVHPDHLGEPSITNIVQAMERDTDRESLKNQLLATINRRDLRKLLPQINVPIHLIGSNEDAICTIEPMQILSTGDTISFTDVGAPGANSGHMIPLEAPDVLAKAMKSFFDTLR